MPYFCRYGHPVLTVNQFLRFVDPFLPQEPVLDLPRITRLVDFTGGMRLSFASCLVLGVGNSAQYGGNCWCLATGVT